MWDYLTLVGIGLQMVSAYIGNSLFIGKLRISKRRILEILAASIVGSILFQWIGVYTVILLFLVNSYFNYKSLKNWIPSIGIHSLVMIFNVLADHLSSWVLNSFEISRDYSLLWVLLVHMLIAIAISLVFIFLAKKILSRYLLKNLNSNEGNIVSFIFFFTYGVYLICIFLGVKLGNTLDLIQLNLVFFIFYLLFTLVAFSIYSRTLRKELRIKQTKAEYESIQQYTEGLESQYNQIRKFRHDYQNILSSLDSYIEENDWDGLRNYYQKSIRKSSRFITVNNFRLDDLSKIKVMSIKSLLVSKLIYAQELELDVSFEAREDIHKIPVDPLLLIRLLGILLDNAIEEVSSLGYGVVRVAAISHTDGLQLVIENTCRKDIEPLFKLQKSGYSTKGENRGLGLSNVTELVSDMPMLMSETIIENDTFTQIIYISEEK